MREYDTTKKCAQAIMQAIADNDLHSAVIGFRTKSKEYGVATFVSKDADADFLSLLGITSLLQEDILASYGRM